MRWLVPISLLLAGCATVRITDPARTATEQFLLSQAASRAVEQLVTDALHDRKVYVDTTYFAASEQAFVIGELRAKLLFSGVRLVSEAKDADLILEVRSGGVGIDRYEFLLGIPSLYLASSNGTPVPTTPELAIWKNTRQFGVASVAFVAYRVGTGELVSRSGPFIGRALREDWWIFGSGPRTVGNIPTTERPR